MDDLLDRVLKGLESFELVYLRFLWSYFVDLLTLEFSLNGSRLRAAIKIAKRCFSNIGNICSANIIFMFFALLVVTL